MLLIVVASPVVSLGGTRSLLLGLVLAALTVGFLWLERLPLRPGLGVAALLAVALAGALPLAAVADRGEPWFDYRSFAEGLGPDDPVHFSWSQTLRADHLAARRQRGHAGQARASRCTGRRATSTSSTATPGTARTTDAAAPAGDEPWDADVPGRLARTSRPGRARSRSRIRRMRTTDVLGAGTIMEVQRRVARRSTRGSPRARWDSVGALRRGDSYTLQVHAPKPDPGALSEAVERRDRRGGATTSC